VRAFKENLDKTVVVKW